MHDGWREVALGDLAEIRIGRTPPRDEPRYWTPELTRPFCSIADMTDFAVRPTREGVTEAAEREGRAKRVPAGSLLLSFKLTIGRVGIAEVDVFPNEAIAWVEPRPDAADKRYLALWLGHQDLTSSAGRAVKGNTLNSVSLRAIKVVLPPLNEQRRIVDLIGCAETAIVEAQRLHRSLQRMRAGVRENILAEARDHVTLGDLLLGIEAGRSPDGVDRKPDRGEVSVLKVSAVRLGWFDRSQIKVVPSAALFPPRARVAAGDLLMTRANTKELVGAVCVVDDPYPDCYLCDKTLRLVPDLRRVTVPYLLEALLASESRRQLSAAATGTSATMKNISQDSIRRVRVPLISRADQDRLTAMTASLADAADAALRYRLELAGLRTRLASSLLTGEHTLPATYDRLLEDVA